MVLEEESLSNKTGFDPSKAEVQRCWITNVQFMGRLARKIILPREVTLAKAELPWIRSPGG